MDPYNTGPAGIRRSDVIPAETAGNDPFETTINTALERVECLRRVVEARKALKRAQFVLAHEEAEAAKLGAYSVLPEAARPGVAS